MRNKAKAMIEEERQKRRPMKATKQFQHVRPRVNTNNNSTSKGTKNKKETETAKQLQHEEEFNAEDYNDDWRLPLSSSGRETRFSEIDADARRERISQIVEEICSARPTAEGSHMRLSRSGRTSSLRRSPSLQSLRSLSLQSVIRTPQPLSMRRSPSLSSMVSRSCQTEGETALGAMMPLTATSKEVLMPMDKQAKVKRKGSNNNSSKKKSIPRPPSPALSIFDRLSAIESEVKELKLDLNGIEGAIDADNVDVVDDKEDYHKESTNDALPTVDSKAPVDYVSANIDAASDAGHARRVTTTNSAGSARDGRTSQNSNMHEAGTVPKYLKQRQKRWETYIVYKTTFIHKYFIVRMCRWRKEEEQRKKDEEESASCPPGHRKLSKAEQDRILSELKQEWEETVRNQVKFYLIT